MTISNPGYLVGVAVIVIDEQNRVLLGLRSKENLWASFGGRVEAHESAQDCAIRELEEEVGLELTEVVPHSFGQDITGSGTHYVALYFSAKLPKGAVPVIREPKLTLQMDWFDIASLPANMWEQERAVIVDLLTRA